MTPVSLSKITPPQLANTLPRPRLLNLFNKNADKKLILILGQAAQGKTTLAASCLKQISSPSAWVNIGPEESDPANLFYAIIQSLQQALKESDLSSLRGYPTRTMGPRDPIGFYKEWIRDLGNFIHGPVYLVLDGLDRLVPDSPAFSFLQVLLNESPSELRLLMTSRFTPATAFNYQPLKMRQQVLVLRNEELAFTQEEVRVFFTKTLRISLNSESLQKIHKATEGWIGGLILMAEILGRGLLVDPEPLLKDGFLSRFRGEAFEFLGREIFSAQTSEVQDLLMKSSIFPSIDSALIKELTEFKDGEEIFQALVKRNLFVQGIPQLEKGWIFRFHQLFREFLLNRFQETFSLEEQVTLYRQAANLFEERGDLESAGALYIQAKDFDRAAASIKKIGIELYHKGRIADLSTFLKTLPEEMIQADPWLLLLFSLTRRWTEFQQNCDRLRKCLSLFKKEQDTQRTILSLSYLIEASMTIGVGRSIFNDYLNEAETWVASPLSEPFPSEKAFLLIQIGIVYYSRGDTRKGEAVFRKAYQLARSFKDHIIEARALCHLIGALSLLGEFNLAKEVSNNLRRLMETIKDIEPKAWGLIENIVFNVFEGNREEALELLTRAKEIVYENGILYLFIPLQFYELIYLGLLGNSIEVQVKGREYLLFCKSLGQKFSEGASLNIMGMSLYLAGLHEEARDLLDQTVDLLSSDEGYSISHLNSTLIVRSLNDHHLGIRIGIIERLEAVLKYAEKAQNFLYQSHGHLALGLVHGYLGNKRKAAIHLKRGFQVAKEKGQRFFVFLNPQDVISICLLAFELEVTEAYDLARELLTNRYAKQAEPELFKLAEHPLPQMRVLGQELLRVIHKQRVQLLEIKTLGGLKIIRGGTMIEETAWDRLQPKRLLMALLRYPGGKVSKNRLMENLWPGETTEKAENNFKVTLLRLRKALEPEIHPIFGSSYIHLHNNLVFLDPEFTLTDVDNFLIALDKGNRKDRAQDTRGAMEEYKKALEIYQGDFLPLDPSLPVVEQRRDELKQAFIETLLRLAKLSEEKGSMNKATGYLRRVLEADPLQEEACRALMRLCLTLGNYNEALKAFETLKRTLRKELKSCPDPQTQALCNRIRDKADK